MFKEPEIGWEIYAMNNELGDKYAAIAEDI